MLAAALVVAALGWLYVAHVGAGMRAPGDAMADMPGMSGMTDMPGMTSSPGPLLGSRSLLMLAMWFAMMVGMMTPSVAPMLIIYAHVARQAAATTRPLAAVGWFAGGYLSAWAAFSVVAVVAQWLLERALLLSPGMAMTSSRVAGAVLLIAGAYQWTPLKEACLTQCRAPLAFIQRRGGFRQSRGGSWQVGFFHGLYCIGCCWALMAVLFVVGVMSLAWVAALMLWVLIEKIAPRGRMLARVGGVALAAFGLAMLGSGG